MLFIDLDDFKAVNDEMRPRASATSCSSASPAGCAAACARPTRSARLGGDEFGVLLERVPGPTRWCRRPSASSLASASRSSSTASRCGRLSIGIAVSGDARPRRRRAAAPGRPRDVRGQARRQAPLGPLRPRPRAPGAPTGRRARARDLVPARDEQREEISACCSATTRSAWPSSRSSTCAPARRRLRGARALLGPRAGRPTRGSRRRTAVASATSSRRGRSRPRSPRPGRPAGTLPHGQPQPVRADVDAGPGRAAGVARRRRDRAHRERAAQRRARRSRRRSPTSARAAAASRSTTPAPATPGSST